MSDPRRPELVCARLPAKGSSRAGLAWIVRVGREGRPPEADRAKAKFARRETTNGRSTLVATFAGAPRVLDSKKYPPVAERRGGDDLNPVDRVDNPYSGPVSVSQQGRPYAPNSAPRDLISARFAEG